jgi:hypothetical protein
VFHSQPAAVTAFLTWRQIPFRKTHELADLGLQCAGADPNLERIPREIADLTDFASAFHDLDRT